MIEVTSSTSLDVCKKICDELLVKMLEMGLGKDSAGEKKEPYRNELILSYKKLIINNEILPV